jgi:hypothetical protein
MMLVASSWSSPMIRRVVHFLLPCCLLLAFAVLGTRPSWSAQQTAGDIISPDNLSGTYSFLREGEFVQLTVEDGKLSGYISRFGDTESDKGQFIDQFFDKTSLDGIRLSFDTKTVHGVWYDFSGVIATAPNKKPGEEGYRVVRGKLVQHTTDESGKEKVMQRQVEFKSFPAEVNR